MQQVGSFFVVLPTKQNKFFVYALCPQKVITSIHIYQVATVAAMNCD